MVVLLVGVGVLIGMALSGSGSVQLGVDEPPVVEASGNVSLSTSKETVTPAYPREQALGGDMQHVALTDAGVQIESRHMAVAYGRDRGFYVAVTLPSNETVTATELEGDMVDDRAVYLAETDDIDRGEYRIAAYSRGGQGWHVVEEHSVELAP